MEDKLLSDVQSLVNSFDPISLKDMSQVKLMNRVDTKFVIELKTLHSFLSEVKPFYHIMEVDGVRISDYRTDYYDSKNLGLYRAHHNGKLNRNKIRYREYVNSKLSFLEVKFKNNKGKTLKSRIKSWNKNTLSASDYEFLQTKAPFKKGDLVHSLTNNFSRITLVNNEIKERVTIDLSLVFHHKSKSKAFNNLVVLEVKQEKFNLDSPVIQALKRRRIRSRSFSKYVTGVAVLHKHVKYNNFKENLLFLNKICSNRPIWKPVH